MCYKKHMFDETFDQDKSHWTKETRGIDFVEAREAWLDPNRVEVPANRIGNEDRFLTVGQALGRVWTVGWTVRVTGIRIFMVRPSRDDEKEQYELAK